MKEFELYVGLIVWDKIGSLPKRKRDRIEKRLLELQENPRAFSDYPEENAIGRLMDVHVFEEFAIKYWIDYGDLEIRVFDLQLADR